MVGGHVHMYHHTADSRHQPPLASGRSQPARSITVRELLLAVAARGTGLASSLYSNRIVCVCVLTVTLLNLLIVTPAERLVGRRVGLPTRDSSSRTRSASTVTGVAASAMGRADDGLPTRQPIGACFGGLRVSFSNAHHSGGVAWNRNRL